MKTRKTRSLSTKIVLSVASVFLLIFFTVFIAFDKINKSALYTAEKEKAGMIAETIAPILAVELYLERQQNLLNIASQVIENPNILSFVIKQNGKIIVDRKSAPNGGNDAGKNFIVETELMHPVTQKPIATLHLDYSSAHYHHLAGQYQVILLITLSALSFLMLLFTFYLRHLLTPLKHIASRLGNFTPGQELSLPFYNNNDEIGNIANALKEMNIRITQYAHQQENTAHILEQEVEKKTAQLTRQLYTDALTGYANRARLMLDINAMFDGVILLINIDEFQQINDFYGHIAGDHVLSQLAESLKEFSNNSRHEMNVYRLSGDEFALLTTDPMGYNGLQLFLQALNDYVEASPLRYEEAEINIRITLGASMDINNGMEKADMALKTARQNQKPFMIYDESLNIEHQYQQNMLWIQRLTNAIAEDRIVPYYQPIFNNKTGALSNYECLIRMIEKNGNVLTPYHFLDISKKARLYTRLTRIMIEKSCHHFADKKEHFSINISVDDILDSDTVNFIKQRIKFYNVEERITFEILESEGIEDYPEILQFVEEMKLLGCRFSIDDFGSGYSNFEHLLRLKIDYIKIDGSLIRNLHTDSSAISIIQAIVYFAKKRDLVCIAEFVHNAEVHQIVKQLGIEHSQGFHLGEPLPNTL